MSKRADEERKRLHGIESHLWTGDPDFYRQFDQAWAARSRPGPDRPHHRRRRSPWRPGIWMLPVSLIASGILLCMLLIESR